MSRVKSIWVERGRARVMKMSALTGWLAGWVLIVYVE